MKWEPQVHLQESYAEQWFARSRLHPALVRGAYTRQNGRRHPIKSGSLMGFSVWPRILQKCREKTARDMHCAVYTCLHTLRPPLHAQKPECALCAGEGHVDLHRLEHLVVHGQPWRLLLLWLALRLGLLPLLGFTSVSMNPYEPQTKVFKKHLRNTSQRRRCQDDFPAPRLAETTVCLRAAPANQSWGGCWGGGSCLEDCSQRSSVAQHLCRCPPGMQVPCFFQLGARSSSKRLKAAVAVGSFGLQHQRHLGAGNAWPREGHPHGPGLRSSPTGLALVAYNLPS